VNADPCKLCGKPSKFLHIESVEPLVGYPICFDCSFEKSGGKAMWDAAWEEIFRERDERLRPLIERLQLEGT
jgi:hypothetical protein